MRLSVAAALAAFLWAGATQAQDVTNVIQSGAAVGCAQLPALTGDTTTSSGSCATTTSKIGGVALTLGGALTTTGAGAVTFALPSSTATMTFPSASATLPAYVAGSWTPAVTASSTAGTPAYTLQIGSYEQIGRQVTVRFVIQLSGWTGSPSGNVTITGLPVPSANVANDNGACHFDVYVVSGLTTGGAGVNGFINANASVINVNQSANTGVSLLTAAQAGTTPEFFGFCSYRAS